MELIAGPVKLQAQTSAGERLWTVEADSAVGSLDPKGSFGDLESVRAVLYDEDRPTVYLKAAKGWAHEALGKLVLTGSVIARSPDRQMDLSCGRMVWLKETRTLIATGDVQGSAGGLRMAAADEVRAQFESKDDAVKKSAAAAVVLTSLVAQGQDITYRDNAGNMVVTGIDSWSWSRDKDTDNVSFEGEGSPIVAQWVKQGFTVKARKAEGTLLSIGEGKQQRLELRAGKFSGGASALLKSATGDVELSDLSEYRMNSDDGTNWSFSGDGSPFVGSWPGRGLRVEGRHVQGTAMRVQSAGKTMVEWRTVEASGGISARFVETPREAGGEKWVLTATCPAMSLDRGSSRMALTGGVKINGNHPMLGPSGGEFTAPWIVVTFDEQMRTPVRIVSGKGKPPS